MAPTPRRSRILERAMYARTPGGPGGNLLVNDPDGYPTDYPPTMWWFGYDSGGGVYPIGPNGPWSTQAGAIPAVTRATELITGPLTGAPFRVLSDTAPGATILTPPRWVTDPMLLRPDARFPAQVWPAAWRLGRAAFWTEWLRSAIWWGLGAFVYLPDSSSGGPLAGTMFVVNPYTLTTVRDANGTLVWQLGASADTGDALTFDPDGVFRAGALEWHLVVLRNPLSPVDGEGMSRGVFAMAPGTFGLGRTLETYQAGQFRAGVPNGYLKTEVPGMNQDQADLLKARWLAAHGGDRRSIAVLNATTSFVPINLSPVDAALDQVKRLNIADVAFAFGIDPYTLGAGLGNSATYSNLRDAWQNHRDFGLGAWIAAMQDCLSALLSGTQTVVPNLDGFANPTPAERFNAYAVAISSGVLTPDEARQLEGLPALTTPEPPAIEPPPSQGATDVTAA